MALIYLIDFFRESKVLNLEIVLKIIFSLQTSFIIINHNKINETICQFESKVFETIKYCFNKFIEDFQIEEENHDTLDNFDKIMNCVQNLFNVNIPFHLKGFINYYYEQNYKKFLLIKMYEYITEINPFKKEKTSNINYHLYQGYSLYEIIFNSENEDHVIDVSYFYNIKNNRIKNIHAKAILELSIKL